MVCNVALKKNLVTLWSNSLSQTASHLLAALCKPPKLYVAKVHDINYFVSHTYYIAKCLDTA